jgi:ABC-type transport system involved in cytochrome c biogenesis permease subunit
MAMHAFGRLPVAYQGRVKPFDTLARNSLVIISERQTYRDENGTKHPAIRWLLDVISGSEAAMKHRVFRIPNLELIDALGLPKREHFRYAYEEFQDSLHSMDEEIGRVQATEPSKRDVYDNQLHEFFNKVHLFSLLIKAHRLPALPADHDQLVPALRQLVSEYQFLEQSPLPFAVPPLSDHEQWRPLMRAAIESMVAENPNPAIGPLATVLDAWRAGDEVGFNSALAGYQSILAGRPPAESSTLDFEVFFNHLEPFYHCSVLYVLAFLLSAFAWMGWSGPLNRTATWLILLTLVVHTFALGARVYISGYPPITNLYGTAVFIGWACVILGLIIEAVYRIGIGNLVASVAGFATLLIAHFLAGDGDTLEMMQAVLDTKFWLATHVVVINLGYSATLFAGGLGVLFILRGVLGSSLDKDLEKTFGRMIYGVLCFALLMSFVGTVLGGLWADDSWGRFWGWDPKENGALLIVLWDALVLHARWGGMIKTRGIAVMAVFGGIVTGWSWFGVNQLGVGLHSYGFTDSVAFWLLVFVASQLGAMGMGMLPRSWWRSARVPGKRLIKALNGG